MQAGKLFRVLVVGGSMLLSDLGCEGSTDNNTSSTGGTPPPSSEQDDAGQTQNTTASGDAGQMQNNGNGKDAGMTLASLDSGTSTNVDPSENDAGGDIVLAPCFCNTDDCCEPGEDGGMTVQQGFECCWGTTC